MLTDIQSKQVVLLSLAEVTNSCLREANKVYEKEFCTRCDHPKECSFECTEKIERLSQVIFQSRAILN